MSKPKKPQPKAAIVTRMLCRDKGATITELAKATGWKDHSVRAFLSGIRKKQTLIKEERSDGVTTYRLGAAELAEPASAPVPQTKASEGSE